MLFIIENEVLFGVFDPGPNFLERPRGNCPLYRGVAVISTTLHCGASPWACLSDLRPSKYVLCKALLCGWTHLRMYWTG